MTGRNLTAELAKRYDAAVVVTDRSQIADLPPGPDRDVIEALARGDTRASYVALAAVHRSRRRDRPKIRRPRLRVAHLAGRRTARGS